METAVAKSDAKKQFSASTNGETFSGFYDSVEEALCCHANDNEHEVGTTVYVGEVEPYQPVIYTNAVLDRLADNAYDACGEHADGWLTGVPQPAYAELGEALNNVLNSWLKRHGLEPRFFAVTNVKPYVVTEEHIS
jgi:hypothetical protein